MKEMGLTAELRFHFEASERGLIIAIPCGEQVYDCVIDNGERLFKVQVKSTSRERFEKKDKFRVLLTSGNVRRAYTAKEVDVFAIFIIPLKIWYLVPQLEVDGRINLALHPFSNSCPVKEFQNNWSVFSSNQMPPNDSSFNNGYGDIRYPCKD